MDLSGLMNWGTLASIASGVGGATTTVLAIVNRQRIADYFANRVALVTRLRSLENENAFLRQQVSDARAAAQFMGDTSAFTRAEALDLLGRVEKLEKYVPKFEAAIAYIKTLLAHCNLIEMWAQRRELALPAPVPKAPSEIVDDIG